jgi:hypothetical protein
MLRPYDIGWVMIWDGDLGVRYGCSLWGDRLLHGWYGAIGCCMDGGAKHSGLDLSRGLGGCLPNASPLRYW